MEIVLKSLNMFNQYYLYIERYFIGGNVQISCITNFAGRVLIFDFYMVMVLYIARHSKNPSQTYHSRSSSDRKNQN